MTWEAQEYLRKLFEKDSSKFFEIIEEVNTGKGIISAVLNESALTDCEKYDLHFHIRDGNPTIVIEYRADAIRKPISGFRFTEPNIVGHRPEFLIPDYPSPPTHILDASKYYERDFISKKWGYMIKKNLLERLKKSEESENYEDCAEIIKYAESQGWDLRKES